MLGDLECLDGRTEILISQGLLFCPQSIEEEPIVHVDRATGPKVDEGIVGFLPLRIYYEKIIRLVLFLLVFELYKLKFFCSLLDSRT